MTYYASVYLKEFHIEESSNESGRCILLRIRPAQGFSLQGEDSKEGDCILFRDRKHPCRGFLCSADDLFVVTGAILKEFCQVPTLLTLNQQQTCFTVELSAKEKTGIPASVIKYYEGAPHSAFTIQSFTYK